MFECVSLFVWPNKANYYIFLLKFYFSYQKLKNHYNGNSSQNGVYLYIYSSKSHDLNTVRKPRRSTSLYSTSTKHDSHVPRRYTPLIPKSPNIAMVFEPTVSCILAENGKVELFILDDKEECVLAIYISALCLFIIFSR